MRQAVDWRAFARLRLALVLVVWPTVGIAQETSYTGVQVGRIVGSVVDAESGRPLRGVVVQVVALDPVTAAHGGNPGTHTISDPSGRYRLDDLGPGEYLLHGSRVGYRSFSIQLTVLPGLEQRVSIGLSVEPIQLEPVELTAARGVPFRRVEPDIRLGHQTPARRPEGTGTRSSIALDASELTFQSLVGGITFGEPDLFRALQRLPSASTRSDYTAELWTRGAAWHETRIYFDGVPLFNPLHGFGTFSGIGHSSLGSVAFHPGVVPASVGEGAAGIVDLETRRGTAGHRPGVDLDLSLVTAGFALDQEHAGGRFAWMVAGRRTYLDWISRLASGAAGDPGLYVPYAFGDLIGRVDVRPFGRHEIEASGLYGTNRYVEASDALASWGNVAGRLTHRVTHDGITYSHTLGMSRNSGSFAELPERGLTPLFHVQGATSTSEMAYLTLRGELSSVPGANGFPSWSGGYELTRQSADYTGPTALPIPRPVFAMIPDDGVCECPRPPADRVTTPAVAADGDLEVASMWVSNHLEVGPFSAQSGGRLELGSRVRGTRVARAAPRLAIRYDLSDRAALSAGLSRSFQYSQAIAPTGLHLASLSSSYFWIVADPRTPPLRADLLTLGGRYQPFTATSVALHAFARRTNGVITPDPSPGPLFDRRLQLGSTFARGLELSGRASLGLWRGAAAYTLSQSTGEAASLRYPAAEDQRHVVTLSSSVRPLDRWVVSGAFTRASGIPYTRIYGGDIPCPAEYDCAGRPLPWTGAPNAQRSSPYASLDLLVERSSPAFGGSWDLFVQVRNVLGRQNGTLYADVPLSCGSILCDVAADPAERLERGLPRLAIVGSRIRI
jgi:hypothetical protein